MGLPQDGLGLGHTPTFTMPATATIPIAGPTHPKLWPSPNPPACSPETIQAWPMTEESPGSPGSRAGEQGGEVIGIAGCGSRK